MTAAQRQPSAATPMSGGRLVKRLARGTWARGSLETAQAQRDKRARRTRPLEGGPSPSGECAGRGRGTR